MQRDDIVRLATARNPAEAHVIQQALEEEGIASHVVGDFLDAGVGDVGRIRPEIWVHRADLERASAFLEAHQAAAAEKEDDEAS